MSANLPEERIKADVIVVAVGQRMEARLLGKTNIPVDHGRLKAMKNRQIFDNSKIFAGGECVTGPATVIRAITAGKIAAANIDQFLGFNHDWILTSKYPLPESGQNLAASV